MTALAGFWSFDGRPDAAERCRRMLAAQSIYGRGGPRDWDGGFVALGRDLFATLPEDAHDLGPIVGGDGRYALVADVRLDNREELADSLGIAPAQARTLPDAAFVLRAWERWEEASLARLYGDYAFALWDARERRLMLARDALGGRPLHYRAGDGFAAFASMPKGLHALAEIPRAPDLVRVAEVLALLPEDGARSFFEGVSRVEQGHFVSITALGAVARRHWDPRPGTIARWHGGDAVEAMREQLDRAVAVRLRGAGDNVGAQLSAGLDSSAVASTAARLMAARGGKVTAFTAVPRSGYDDPAPAGRIGDESELAALTAALHPNMEHVRVRARAGRLIEGLDRAFALLDRPMMNACNMPWVDAIHDEARARGLSVLLTGQMGNLTISYQGMELLPELARRGRWLRLLREGRALAAGGRSGWRGTLASAAAPWLPSPAWRALQRLRNHSSPRIGDYSMIGPEFARLVHVERRAGARDLSDRLRRSGFAIRVAALRSVDPANYHKGVLGGWGLDSRDPTSDRRLAEFCLSLPMEEYLSQGQPRALALRALADRVPAPVLAEPRRGVQAADWPEALTASRDQLREEVERIAGMTGLADVLDLPRMRSLIDDWPTGGWDTPAINLTYRLALLRGIASSHFLRSASRDDCARTPS